MKNRNLNSFRFRFITLYLVASLLANHTQAAVSYWDPEGRTGNDSVYTGGSLAGSWEGVLWARNAAGATGRPADQGTNAPVVWVDGDAAVFAVGAGATNNGVASSTTTFTVTMNQNHTVAGFFIGPLNPNSCHVTIQGAGTLTM